MDTKDFMKFRIPFEKAARARFAERINNGLTDGNFEQHVLEEMLMFLIDENKRLREKVDDIANFIGLPEAREEA